MEAPVSLCSVLPLPIGASSHTSVLAKSQSSRPLQYDANMTILRIQDASWLSGLLGQDTTCIHPDNDPDHERYRQACQSLLKVSIGSPTASATGPFINKYVVTANALSILSAQAGDPASLIFQFHHNTILCRICKEPSDPDSTLLMELWFSKVTPCYIDSVTLNRGGLPDYVILVGFTNGEIMLWHVLGAVFSRFNRNAIYNAAPISSIQWIPDSDSHFLVAFKNGLVVLFDRFKEDSPFEFSSPESDRVFHIIHPTASIQDRSNPVSIWNTGSDSIASALFSPDRCHIAILGLDGTCKIVNITTEKLEDIHCGYYGALSCIAWSPDNGSLFVTGGEDDIVTIWSFGEKRQLVRGYGHRSFVSSAVFLPIAPEHPSIYRIVSVGQDGLICLWEFDSKAVYPKPRPPQAEPVTTDVVSYFDVPRLEPIWIIPAPDQEPLTFVCLSTDPVCLYIRSISGKVYQYVINKEG